MDVKNILAHCDHTLLKQESTWAQIKEVCDDGLKYGCASVCIPASFVKQAADYVGNELKICKAIKASCQGRILKVIVETCLLTEAEKIKLCELVTESGADYIKTSTGFSTGGATREDVALFKAHIGPGVKIKAAGGISSLQDAEDFMALGADRLGTSRIVKLVKGEHAEGY